MTAITEGDHKGRPYGMAYFIKESFSVKRLSFRGNEAEMGGQDSRTVFGGNEFFCCYTIADSFQGVTHKYYLASFVLQYDNQFFDKNRIGVC